MGLIRGVALEEGLLAVAGFGEVFEGEVAVIEVLGDEAGEVDFGEEGDLELDVAGVGVEEVAGGGDAGVDDGEGFGGAAHVVEELGAFLGDVDLELAAGEGAGFGGGEAAEAGGGAEEEFVGVVEAVVGPGGGGEFGFADDEGAVGAGAEVLWEVGLAGEGFPAIEGFLGVAEHACAIEGFAGGVGAEEIGEGAEGGTAFGHGGEVVLLDGGHEGDGIANGLKAGGGFAGAGEDFAEFAFEVGEALLRMATQAPNLHNQYEAYKQMYVEMGVDPGKIERLLPPPQEAVPLDPLTENQNALIGKPLKAAVWQDHNAHIMSHQPLAENVPSMQAHIAEHMALQMRVNVEKQLGIQLPPETAQLPPEIQNQIAVLVSQAIQQLNAPKADNPTPEQIMMEDLRVKALGVQKKWQETLAKQQGEAYKARMQFITEERNRESRERIAAMKEQAREIDRRAQRAERAAAAFGRREKF